MKKIILFASIVIFSVWAKQTNAQRLLCGTDEHTDHLYMQNPNLKIALDKFNAEFREFITSQKQQLGKTERTYVIPVVVHVFHDNGSENISDAAIINQIERMNRFFAGTDPAVSSVRDIFKPLIADCKIVFRLARKDPQGNCTNGIVRVHTPQTYRGGEAVKALSTWDTRRYFNVWVTREVFSGQGNAVGGFAYLPFGGFSNIRDGVIVAANQTFGPGADNTLAHEAGHWFGLFHPFQGDSCAIEGDGIDDTPPTFFRMSTTGVNIGRGNQCGNPNFNTCSTDDPDLPDMQENIMDYFGGPCSGTIFTLQQKAKMRFCLENYRRELWQENNLIATGVAEPYATTANCAPIAAFNTRTRNICAGGNVQFFNGSYNGTISSLEWTFPGATPGTSTAQSPNNITYSNPGKYDVTLKVTGPNGEHTTTLKDYITVEEAVATRTTGWRTYADWWYQNNWIQEGWSVDREFSTNTFIRTNVSHSNIASMMLPADPFNRLNSINNAFSIISPPFNLSGTTSPYIALNFAFARGTLFGQPTQEKLEVFTSTDCGKTWNLRAQRTPNQISTIGANTVLANNFNFIPSDKQKWGELIFNIPSGTRVQNVRFKISFTYAGGNNFYIDNLMVGDGVPTSAGKELSKEISFALMPNPFTNSALINYSLNQNSHVTINITDILGKEVGVIFNGSQNAGEQEIEINKNNLGLNPGIYMINTTINGQTISQKVVVQ